MAFDDKRASKVFDAAVYVALTAGACAEVEGGRLYRFSNGPWIISFSMLRGATASPGALRGIGLPENHKGLCLGPLPDRQPKLWQDVLVFYEDQAVFRAFGPPAAPRRQQMLAEAGPWEHELLGLRPN